MLISNKHDQRKQVTADDVAAALLEMSELRDRLDWRRRDLRLMFIQSPELRARFEAFQHAGGVTAAEWMAFIEGRFRYRRGVRHRRHLRLLVNQRRPTVGSGGGTGGGTDAA